MKKKYGENESDNNHTLSPNFSIFSQRNLSAASKCPEGSNIELKFPEDLFFYLLLLLFLRLYFAVFKHELVTCNNFWIGFYPRKRGRFVHCK